MVNVSGISCVGRSCVGCIVQDCMSDWMVRNGRLTTIEVKKIRICDG